MSFIGPKPDPQVMTARLPSRDALIGAWAVLIYDYYTRAEQRASELFPGSHPSYLSEWTMRFACGLSHAVGHMDEATFDRFVGLALAACGQLAERRADYAIASRLERER